MGMFIRNHGETFSKMVNRGNGTTVLVIYRWCESHGEEVNLIENKWHPRHTNCTGLKALTAVWTETSQAESSAA